MNVLTGVETDQPITLGNTLTVNGTLTAPKLVTPNFEVIHSGTVVASSALNTAETVLLNIPLVAGTTLKIGSKVRVTAEGTCTDTVANAASFTLRAGILGTTADASVAAIALPTSGTTGTTIPFKVVIEATVQTLGATGTCYGSLTYISNAATGLTASVTAMVPFTSATLATTTATYLDVTFKTAAVTTTATFQDVSIEVTP
jgi:hypothetical protein